MSRGPIPGRAGLIVLAAAAVPIVISAAKPLAKAIGRGLSKIGDKLQEAADEARGKEQPRKEATTTEPKKTEEASSASQAPASASKVESQAKPPQVAEAKPPKKATKAKSRPKAQAAKTKRKRSPAPDDFETA